MSQKTKERILQAALELFNDAGLSRTPSRAISLHLGISQGHLTYHFRKRQDILDALYGLYQDQVTVILNPATAPTDDYSFKAWVQALLEMNYTFRFLFLDFGQVMRESGQFKKAYHKLQLLRKQILLEYIDTLTLKSDTKQLAHQVELLLDFGMVQDLLSKKASHKKLLQKIHADIIALLCKVQDVE